MFVKLYLIALPVFFGIDLIWLGLIARKFYQEQLGELMRVNVNWPAGIIFYLLFLVGLVFFAINPALEKKSILSAALLGGLFGFFTYATYDLTNLATLKNWPLTITVVDIIWGIVLSTSVSVVTFFIASKISL